MSSTAVATGSGRQAPVGGGWLNQAAMVYRVWRRNGDAFLRIWKTEFPGILGEPIFALAAFGTGLGFYLRSIDGVEYAAFVAPGLVAGYTLFGATFETTFGVYHRMSNHRSVESILATPVTLREWVLAEMCWGATRAALSGVGMLIIGSLFGFFREPWAVLIVPAALLIGLPFAAMSLAVTAVVPAISTLNIYFTLVIAPMWFLGGTFFPIHDLPLWLRAVASAMPFTYGVNVVRGLALGEFGWGMLWSALVLVGALAVFAPLAVVLMRRRLVK